MKEIIMTTSPQRSEDANETQSLDSIIPPIRLLNVDDDPKARDRLRSIVEPWVDIELVGEAVDGKEAVEQYQRLNPEVVAIKLNMPGMNGIDATKQIRALDSKANIFMVTGMLGVKAMRDLRLAGARDFLTGPVKPSELLHTVKALATRWEKIDEEVASDTWKKLLALQHKAGLPPKALTSGKSNAYETIRRFDANLIFEILPLVHLKSDFVLDYVYGFDSHGGEPLLYSRLASDSPLSSVDDYLKAFPELEKIALGSEPNPESSKPYLQHLEFEKSTEGFFQFSLFCMRAKMFYLQWNSFYSSRTLFFSQGAIDDLLLRENSKIAGLDEVPRLRQELRPVVSYLRNKGEVSFRSFELRTGYSKFTMSFEWPNHFLGMQAVNKPYTWG